jgi:hypothetical protein
MSVAWWFGRIFFSFSFSFFSGNKNWGFLKADKGSFFFLFSFFNLVPENYASVVLSFSTVVRVNFYYYYFLFFFAMRIVGNFLAHVVSLFFPWLPENEGHMV